VNDDRRDADRDGERDEERDEEREHRPRRRGPMSRVGDLIPGAAAHLGLADELRRARAVATFDAIVAERAPAAHGACRAVRIDGPALVIEADAPIVAQELRLHALELTDAFRAAPAGALVNELRVTVRRP
jgi:Dna[CI] antecedent, DciA